MIKTAHKLLLERGFTCVLTDGSRTYTSTQRGVRPLLELLESNTDCTGFYAADKVVGKATALLYCLLKVRAIHALVISESALAVLENHGIAITFDQKVPQIRNRAGTGRCPMEQATEHIDDPREAPAAIYNKLRQLAGN